MGWGDSSKGLYSLLSPVVVSLQLEEHNRTIIWFIFAKEVLKTAEFVTSSSTIAAAAAPS